MLNFNKYSEASNFHDEFPRISSPSKTSSSSHLNHRTGSAAFPRRMIQLPPSSGISRHCRSGNVIGGSLQRTTSGTRAKRNLKPLVEPSTSAFSKLRIRKTYAHVFSNAISRFVLPFNISTRAETSDRFTVCARVRPFSEKETIQSDLYDCVTTTDNTVTVHVGNLHLNKLEMKHMTFHLDQIFGKYASNEDVYNAVRKIVVQSIPQENIPPIDSTVFLYGKTGTGKSHTISGITQRFAQDVFHSIQKSQYQLRIGISAVEIVAGTKGFIVSKDNVCDLYNNGALVYFREDADGTVHLRGAKEYPCDNSVQMDSYIQKAKAIRRTQATTRNSESSRSHLIYFIFIRNAADHFEDGQILSKITFVDLAGNEGQQDSLFYKGNSDQIKDSTSINRSLASLQDCIRSAADGSKVIPFRGTVLTRLLKNCFFSKEAKTIFIGTISGLPMDTEQSILTLRYVGLIKWSLQEFIIEQTNKLNTTL